MYDKKDILAEDMYLITDELHEFLSSGVSQYSKDSLPMVKFSEGVYLVVVRVLKNDSNVLIYNYIHYPDLFYKSLLTFLFYKNDYRNGLLYSEWGNLLTITDSYYNNQDVSDRLGFNKYNTHLENLLDSMGVGSYLTIRSYSDLFAFIRLLTCVVDTREMVRLIDLAYRRNHWDFTKILFDNKAYLNVLNRTFEFDIVEDTPREKIDIINGCVFVVKDIKGLINQVKEMGYVFNTGPQKWRGQVNSMNNLLTCLDVDYRNSLYKHNQYHVIQRRIDPKYSLSKSNFSYRNIHQNMYGGVRWYSTKRNKDLVSEDKSSKTYSTKYVNHRLTKINTKNVSSKSFREGSLIYDYLNQWLEKSPINNDTQMQIENYLLDFTYISVDNTNSNPMVDYNLISKEFGHLLLSNKDKINNILNNFKKLKFVISERSNQKTQSRYYLNMLLTEVSNSSVISIMYGRLMRIITLHKKHYNNEGVINIFHDMANNIIKDYYFNLYNKALLDISNKTGVSVLDLPKSLHRYTFSDWKEDNKSVVKVLDDATLKGNIGGILAEWMIECNLIELKVVLISTREKNTILLPTQEVLNTLSDKVKSQVSLPFRLPMIVKPKPYYREIINGVVKERLGGYLLNDLKVTDSLIIYKWNLEEQSNIKDINIVYDLVNNINSVGYKINTDVLDFIYEYGVEYDLIEYKDNPYDDKIKLTKKEHMLRESYQSKLELQNNILGIAKVYSKLHEFFIPVRLDNRGRMYCMSEYLNYQSNELAKSLLLFSKGEKLMKTDIKGINYFKAYGANCFGNKLDKKSWNDRIKWIDDNEDDIINFKNGKLILQASNKLLFVAFCFEYKRLLQSLSNVNTTYFETYLPIQLDATCNGYQHLSLLSLDISLAKELNLITSSWDDVPKDFYNFLSSNLIELFSDKLTNPDLSEIDREGYNRLINLTIQRTIVKKGIMTIPYNVSTNQMIKYIQENFERSDDYSFGDTEEWYYFKDDTSVVLKYADFSKIALGLREVLDKKFFKLKLLMKYLKDIAKICTKLDIVIPWGLPSGVVVKQSYLATKEVRLKPFTYSKNSFNLKVLDEKGGYNKSKQVRAFMPNLIHSLDAASLALLVDLYFKNNYSAFKNIYGIHDCFAVTANNVENLMQFLKLVYIKIYSEGKYLKDLDSEIRHQIKLQYGNDCFDDTTLKVKTEYFSSKYPDIDEVLGLKLPSIPKLKTEELNYSSYIIN